MLERRVLFCGPRDWPYLARDLVWREVRDLKQRTDKLGQELVVIHGDASGVDLFAKLSSEALGVRHRPFPLQPQEWSLLGGRAGPLRNAQMLSEGKPSLVYAFGYGRGARRAWTPGTGDMVQKSRRAGLEVVEIWSDFTAG